MLEPLAMPVCMISLVLWLANAQSSDTLRLLSCPVWPPMMVANAYIHTVLQQSGLPWTFRAAVLPE